MRISPIQTYNNSYCNKANNHTRISAQKPIFKSEYGNVYREAFGKNFTNSAEAMTAIEKLFAAARKTFELFIPPITTASLWSTIYHAADNYKDIINKDNKLIASMKEKRIEFFDEDDKESYISFTIDGKDRVEVTQYDQYSYEEFVFWPTRWGYEESNIYKHTRSSGWGMGQDTKTTYYNKDGSEASIGDRLKRFFNI